MSLDLTPVPVDVEQQEAWMTDAACTQTDPDIFFPEKGESSRPAKKICGTCSVTAECLAYALGNGTRFGVWGGASERERRQIGRAA